MQNYGINALRRLNARSGGGTHGQHTETNNIRSAEDHGVIMCRIKRLVMYMIPCLHRDHDQPASRSNRHELSYLWLLVMLWHGLLHGFLS
jgi:hypothetical protein